MSEIGKWTQIISDWFIKVTRIYFSSTPENVEVKGMNASGEVVTMTIPNAAQFRKQVWDDVGGALGQFSKIIYVDSEGGDDGNVGTPSSKVKTIAKALSLASTSNGRVAIYLYGDNHTIDSTIYGKFQDVKLLGGSGSGAGSRNNLTFTVHSSGGYNSLPNFRVFKSIEFYKLNILFDLTLLDTSLSFTSDMQTVSYADMDGISQNILFSSCKVSLPDDSHIGAVKTSGASNANMSVSLYATEIESLGSNSNFAQIANSTLNLSSYGTALTGDITSWQYLVDGIIRDADSGNPINVTSNINFSS